MIDVIPGRHPRVTVKLGRMAPMLQKWLVRFIILALVLSPVVPVWAAPAAIWLGGEDPVV